MFAPDCTSADTSAPPAAAARNMHKNVGALHLRMDGVRPLSPLFSSAWPNRALQPVSVWVWPSGACTGDVCLSAASHQSEPLNVYTRNTVPSLFWTWTPSTDGTGRRSAALCSLVSVACCRVPGRPVCGSPPSPRRCFRGAPQSAPPLCPFNHSATPRRPQGGRRSRVKARQRPTALQSAAPPLPRLFLGGCCVFRAETGSAG